MLTERRMAVVRKYLRKSQFKPDGVEHLFYRPLSTKYTYDIINGDLRKITDSGWKIIGSRDCEFAKLLRLAFAFEKPEDVP